MAGDIEDLQWHQDRVRRLEHQLAEAQAMLAESEWFKNRYLRERNEGYVERDALQATLAEMRAACLASTQRNVALQRVIEEKQSDLDNIQAALVRLSPTLSNDPRPHTVEEQIAIVEQEYHALVQDHADLETTLEQARRRRRSETRSWD